MTVALGTSTPTSMTVVHTSTSISPARKRRHRAVLLVGGQPAVHQPQPQVRQLAGTQSGEEPLGGFGRPGGALVIAAFVGLVDPGCHDVSLTSGCDLLVDALPGPVQPRGLVLDEDRPGGDRLSSAREFAQRRGFQVAVVGERHRARYRRSRHHQQVRGDARTGLGAQLGLAARHRTGVARRPPPCPGCGIPPRPAAARGCRRRCRPDRRRSRPATASSARSSSSR